MNFCADKHHCLLYRCAKSRFQCSVLVPDTKMGPGRACYDVRTYPDTLNFNAMTNTGSAFSSFGLFISVLIKLIAAPLKECTLWLHTMEVEEAWSRITSTPHKVRSTETKRIYLNIWSNKNGHFRKLNEYTGSGRWHLESQVWFWELDCDSEGALRNNNRFLTVSRKLICFDTVGCLRKMYYLYFIEGASASECI